MWFLKISNLDELQQLQALAQIQLGSELLIEVETPGEHGVPSTE